MHILSAPTHLFAAIILLLAQPYRCKKYMQLRHMAKPPLLAPPFPDNPRFLPQETKKLFHPLQLRQSLLTATVWKSAPDASA